MEIGTRMCQHVVEFAHGAPQRPLPGIGRRHAVGPVEEIQAGTIVMDVDEIAAHGRAPGLEGLRALVEARTAVGGQRGHLGRGGPPGGLRGRYGE